MIAAVVAAWSAVAVVVALAVGAVIALGNEEVDKQDGDDRG